MRIAVLGGTTFELNGPFGAGLVTQVGDGGWMQVLVYQGVEFDYFPFHGYSREDRSDRLSGVNFVRMFAAMRERGVTHAFGGATSGNINEDYRVGDLIVPHDLIDFNKERPSGVWEAAGLERPSIRARFSPAFCPDLSHLLYEVASARYRGRVHDSGVVVQSQPNRYETAAEIRMYRILGGDMVTHNVGTEAIYARQMGIHFAALQSISNPAEGVQPFTIESEMMSGKAISEEAVPIVLEAIVQCASRTPTCGIVCTGEPFYGVVS